MEKKANGDFVSAMKKTTEEPSRTPKYTPIPSLPDALLVSCLARVSRLYYPNLSLVSKSFKSLLASPELYQTRSSIDQTESCLYVCLKFPSEPSPRWYTLCLKPNPTQTNDTVVKKKRKKSSGYVLARIPVHDSPPAHWLRLVTVGSDIYNIGESLNKELSDVSILDCRSHTWREGPRMLVGRSYPIANVLGGKIYVAGRCWGYDHSNWMEVFDPKTGIWELVSSNSSEICGCKIWKSAGIDGKVYVFENGNGLAYKLNEGKWERAGWNMSSGWQSFSYCVVGNILYSYSSRGITWYDSKVESWRNVKGLKGLPLPKFGSYDQVKSADYGGKMAVLWDKYLQSSGNMEKKIYCAVITLDVRNSEEIWGKVEWHDEVLVLPCNYVFVCALSANV